MTGSPRTEFGIPRYFSQDSNAHVLSVDARKAALLERLIARCKSGYFRRLLEDER